MPVMSKINRCLKYCTVFSKFTKRAMQNTKLNARLALRQRADLLVANISTNRISLPQGQSYTEGKYNNGSLNYSLKNTWKNMIG